MMWVMVSVERGALQGFQRYKAVALSIVGEAGLRLAAAGALVAAGAGVTGAFLGSGLSMMFMAAALWLPLKKCLPAARARVQNSLRSLMAGAWAPVIGLTLLFALQEVHIIVVKHEASADAAGAYAVAAVAAKGIIWVAVGLGMYLLPEAARRSSMGIDARPVLLRTLGLIVAAAVPLLAVFTFAAKPLLSAVFGPDLTEASGALPWLGLAMTLLACAYLSVQYLLALGRWNFIWVLGVAAAVEVGLLVAIGGNLTAVAVGLTCLQVFCAAAVFVISLRSRSGDQPYLTA
jgi:O-antigen/teichoic acid export membrane protein